MEEKERMFSKFFQERLSGGEPTVNPMMDDTRKDSARVQRRGGSIIVVASPPASRRFSVTKRENSRSSILQTQTENDNNTTQQETAEEGLEHMTPKKKGSWVKIQSEAFDSLAKRNSLEKELKDPLHTHHNNHTHHTHTHHHHHHHHGGSGIHYKPLPDEAPQPGIVAKRKMSFTKPPTPTITTTTTGTTTTTDTTATTLHSPPRKLSQSEEGQTNGSGLTSSSIRKAGSSGIRNSHNGDNTTGTTESPQKRSSGIRNSHNGDNTTGATESPQKKTSGSHCKIPPIQEEPSLVEVIQQTRSHLTRVGRPSMSFVDRPSTTTTTTTTETSTTTTTPTTTTPSTSTTPSHVKFSLADTTIPRLPLADLSRQEEEDGQDSQQHQQPEAALPSGIVADISLKKKKAFQLIRTKGKTVVVLQRPKSARELRSSQITPPVSDRLASSQTTLTTPTTPATPTGSSARDKGWVRSNFLEGRRFSTFTLGSARPSFQSAESNLPEPPPHPFADELSSSIATAVYEFKSEKEGDLAFKKGDRIAILVDAHNWWQGRNLNTGEVGIFPSNYVTMQERGLRRALTPPELLKLPPPVDS